MYLHQRILSRFKPNKVVVLHGARRVGKTTLLKSIVGELPQDDFLLLNGEDQVVADQFSIRTTNKKLI